MLNWTVPHNMLGESGMKRGLIYAFAIALILLPFLIEILFPAFGATVSRPSTFLILLFTEIAALLIIYLVRAGESPKKPAAVKISPEPAVTIAPPPSVEDLAPESVDELELPASEPVRLVSEPLAANSEILRLCDDSPHLYCVADFAGHIIEANEAAKTLYREAGLMRNGTTWYDMIHPEDQYRTAMAITSLLAGDTRVSAFRNRIRTGTEYRWLEWTAVSKQDIGRLYIVGQDVTEYQSAFLALSDSEMRFRVAFNSMHEGMILVDRDGRLTLVNHSAKAILGLTKADVHNRMVFSSDFPMLREDGSKLKPEDHPLAKALATGKTQPDLVIGFHGKDGELRWVEANAVPLFHQGELTPYAAVSTLNDVTESREINEQIQSYLVTLEFQKDQLEITNARLEEANHQLQTLATTDAVTGLRNHRAFQERLVEEIMRAERYKTPLSLILLDVDQFKAYNDSYGHPAGDEVLRRIADILRDHARTHDLAARYGGDEFILLTPHTDIAGAEIVAERCRNAIEKVAWTVRPVTASFGVAALGYGIETGAELIACADHALYAAKAGGRNRVSVYSPALGKTAQN